jgi:hypothetical protein
MLHRYSDFIDLISEGSKDKPTFIYWEHQLESILNKEWTDISVEHMADKYKIIFKVGPDKYDFYGMIILRKQNEDIYYVEKPEVTKKFTEKFNHEFWENATAYVKNLKYTPKCLGDVEYVRDSEKYNL